MFKKREDLVVGVCTSSSTVETIGAYGDIPLLEHVLQAPSRGCTSWVHIQIQLVHWRPIAQTPIAHGHALYAH